MVYAPKLISSRMPNGIRVFSMANRLHNVSGTGFRVGSAYDPKLRRGLSHLSEHEVFQFSRRISPRELELLIVKLMGGYDGVNVRVDRISTFFGHQDLNSRRDHLAGFAAMASVIGDALRDVRGMIDDSILSLDIHDTERAAVHNEHRLTGTDIPESEITEVLYQSMWSRNPIRNRIDGEPIELERTSLGDVRKFLRRWYSTDRMFTVFLGLDHAEARRQTEKYYGDLPASHAIEPDWNSYDRSPNLTCVRHVEMVHPGARQHHVAIGFPTDPIGSADDESIDVLAKIWEFRLFQKLRSENRNFRGGVYRVGAFTDRSFLHGLVYSWFATVGSYDYAMQLSSIAERECDELKRKQLSKSERWDLDEEIATVRSNLQREYIGAFKWYPGQAVELIIDAVCNGDYELQRLLQYPARLTRVNRASIHRCAEQYMTTPDRFVRVVLMPLVIPQEIYDQAVAAVPDIEEYVRHFRPTS